MVTYRIGRRGSAGLNLLSELTDDDGYSGFGKGEKVTQAARAAQAQPQQSYVAQQRAYAAPVAVDTRGWPAWKSDVGADTNPQIKWIISQYPPMTGETESQYQTRITPHIPALQAQWNAVNSTAQVAQPGVVTKVVQAVKTAIVGGGVGPSLTKPQVLAMKRAQMTSRPSMGLLSELEE